MNSALGIAYLAGVVVALWASGLELGIQKSSAALAAPLRRVSLLGRVAVVDVIILPLLVWSLVTLVDVPEGYRNGLLLVGIASAGPLGVRATQLARGDAATALSLVVVLELVNLAAVPLWIAVLLPSGTHIAPGSMLATLLLLVLLPLVAGLGCRRFAPRLASRLTPLLSPVANVAIVLAIAAVLVRDADVVYEALGEHVPAVAIITVCAALVLGWFAGGPSRETRIAAALVTGVRSNALALAIAASAFSQSPEVRVGVVVFALFSVTIPFCAGFVLGRRDSAPAVLQVEVPR